jgi:hypothetical protein
MFCVYSLTLLHMYIMHLSHFPCVPHLAHLLGAWKSMRHVWALAVALADKNPRKIHPTAETFFLTRCITFFLSRCVRASYVHMDVWDRCWGKREGSVYAGQILISVACMSLGIINICLDIGNLIYLWLYQILLIQYILDLSAGKNISISLAK